MFKKIVVAYDGSDHAKRALAIACDIAKKYDGALHLSHTPQVDTPRVVVGSLVGAIDMPPTADQIADAGRLILEEARALASDAGRPLASAVVGGGAPDENVVDLAESVGADLIVMGRRGLGAIAGLMLGSVSQHVARDARCACLTVI